MRPALTRLQPSIFELLIQPTRIASKSVTKARRPRPRTLSTTCLLCQFRRRSQRHPVLGKTRTLGSTSTYESYRRWSSDSPKPSTNAEHGNGTNEERIAASELAGPAPPSDDRRRLIHENQSAIDAGDETASKDEHLLATSAAQDPPPADSLEQTPPSQDTSVSEKDITEDAIEKKNSASTSEPSSNRSDEWLPDAATDLAATSTSSNNGSRVPKEDLPSYTQQRRWALSKRLQTIMDHLMSSAAVVSHRVNEYTGTDYTGISALRAEIIDQEKLCRTLHTAVNEAKKSHDAAFAAQAASQKEVVQLLERKHSWAAADLERYMQLIRSEHVNEQAVALAKQNLANAERQLEDARQRLEKIERKQYHEEQIWSDTIRRNSTWVTFGLMGFNILLLLASLGILEPWRRRRLVMEIRSALNEKTLLPAIAEAGAGSAVVIPVVEPAVEPSMTPTDETSEAIREEIPIAVVDTITVDPSGPEEVIVNMPVREPPSSFPAKVFFEPQSSFDAETPPTTTQAAALNSDLSLPLWADTWSGTWSLYKAYWQDLFSERRVALRRVDLTAATLEGAAAGAAFMGLLFVLLRPR